MHGESVSGHQGGSPESQSADDGASGRPRSGTFNADDLANAPFLRTFERADDSFAQEDGTWANDSGRRGVPLNIGDALRGENLFFQERTARLLAEHPEEAAGPGLPGVQDMPIGVALSGGGVRCAAFHCGLLWSLASAGLMKDVRHLSAVSGGGYTAASLVTHFLAEAHKVPRGGDRGGLDQWYRVQTARAIMRMQRNIAFIVNPVGPRQFSLPDPNNPEEAGNSTIPRCFDVPLLLMQTFVAILATPCLIALNATFPVVMCIEQSLGALFREAWCDPDTNRFGRQGAILDWVWSRGIVACCLGACAVMIACSSSCCGCARKRAPRYFRYLFWRSTQQVFIRGAVVYLIYVLLVILVFEKQVVSWSVGHDPHEGDMWRKHHCWQYINRSDTGVGDQVCGDRSHGGGEPFFEVGVCAQYLSWAWVEGRGIAVQPSSQDPASVGGFFTSFLLLICGAFAFLGLLGLFFGLSLMRWFLTVAGPLWAVFLLAEIAQWRVFGPVTGQSLLGSSFLPYTEASGWTVFVVCTVGSIFTVPVYDVLQKLTHYTYRRSLKLAFFHGGQDVNYARSANNIYCPNLILGACINDFQRPETTNEDLLKDFELTPLFLGCLRTGFFPTNRQERLSYVTAISGAAPDTFILQKFDIIPVRFLLSVLSLRLGDFVRVDPDGPTALRVGSRVRRQAGVRPAFGPLGIRPVPEEKANDLGRSAQRVCQRILDRLVVACPYISCQILLLLGVSLESSTSCRAYFTLVRAAAIGFILFFAASFYGFMPCLRWMLRSPIILQFQMFFMHQYQADRPPPYIYLCDGGLIECLGVLVLLRRRMRHIICSDACEDPDQSLRALYDTMVLARNEGLCSFFDVEEPSRDIVLTFFEHRRNPVPYMRVGVRYEQDQPCQGAQVAYGEILYMRMRLMPDDKAPIRPALTMDDLTQPCATSALSGFIAGDDAPLSPPDSEHMAQAGEPVPADGWAGQVRSEMDGACCATKCCPGCPRGGRRFPDFATGNQCLLPEHFANLAALGAEMSMPAVRRLLAHRTAGVAEAAAGTVELEAQPLDPHISSIGPDAQPADVQSEALPGQAAHASSVHMSSFASAQ